MQILFYVLLALATLLGLVVGGVGFILGFVLEPDDEKTGWLVIAGGLIYMLHPLLLYWLSKKTDIVTAIATATLSVLVSALLAFIL
jgi:drug/metabolite transporter (DMT)-like permease